MSGDSLMPIGTASAAVGTTADAPAIERPAATGEVLDRLASTPVVTPTTEATGAQLNSAMIDVTAIGDNTLVAGDARVRRIIYRMLLVFAADCVATFYNGPSTGGAGAQLTGPMSMKAGGSIVLDFDSEPWWVLSIGNAFVLNLSVGVQVSGTVYYKNSAT